MRYYSKHNDHYSETVDMNMKKCQHPLCLPPHVLVQRQPELQQGGGAGAAAAAGEAEGGGGGRGAQRGGAGQPAHPAGHGPQEPQQALPRLAGLGVGGHEVDPLYPNIQRCTLNSAQFYIPGSKQNQKSRCFSKCSFRLVSKVKNVMVNFQLECVKKKGFSR